MPENKENSNIFVKWLQSVEKVGNLLPPPFMLFIYLIIIVGFISFIGSILGLSVEDPATGDTLIIKSLFSTEGILYALDTMIENFIEFKPLGIVLVIMLGIGLAEKTGLFEAVMKKLLLQAPKKLITYFIFFIGICGNLASDAAYIIVPPLAAMIFYYVGRNPLAGLASGIAAVGAAFTANIFIASTDALLSGITTEAAQTIDSQANVLVTDNWYFMIASTFMLMFIGVQVTEKIIEPRLGKYTGEALEEKLETIDPLTNKALRNTLIVALMFIALILTLIFWPNSFLLNEDGSVLDSPFLNNIVPILLIFFILIGVTFGISSGNIKTSSDAIERMKTAVEDMSTFVVLVFAIAQFIAYIDWTNLASYIAVEGSELIQSLNMPNVVIIILFVILTTLLNLFITSGSSQWALMAPIVVPMLMLMDFDPAFIQAAYRVGDSTTNFITPLQPFVAVMLVFLQKYDKKAGFGTHFSLLLPYTIAFLIAWIILLLIFMIFNIPIGPGAKIMM